MQGREPRNDGYKQCRAGSTTLKRIREVADSGVGIHNGREFEGSRESGWREGDEGPVEVGMRAG